MCLVFSVVLVFLMYWYLDYDNGRMFLVWVCIDKESVGFDKYYYCIWGKFVCLFIVIGI